MKKKLLPIVLLSLFGMVLTGCVNDSSKDDKKGDEQQETIAVTGVTLDKSSAEIVKGATLQLTATVAPENASDKTVTWESSNTAVATVANGLVTGVEGGTATITAKAGSFTATCAITVKTVAVTGVTLDKESAKLAVDGTLQLNATVAPADASDKSLRWSSSNPDAAEVSKTGLVTAVGLGKAVITVTTVDGNFKDTCEISVEYDLTAISINNKADFADFHLLDKGITLALSTTPAHNVSLIQSAGDLHVTSSTEGIVEIAGLVITPAAEGKTTITVEAYGVHDEFEVTVLPARNAKDVYGTEHAGTLEDPFTNEDALKVAKDEKYAEDGKAYYVKGEIASFYHAPGARTDGAVSWFLKPAEENGEQFEIYKCYKEDGSFLTDDDVWVGGTAVAHGKFTKYNSQYETSSAVFDSCEGNKPQPRQTIKKTVAEAIADVLLLPDGGDTYDLYEVEGYVSKMSGDDYYITATKGEELVQADYKGKDKDYKYYSNAIELFSVKDETLKAFLLNGAKVKVIATMKNYHGQAENLIALTAETLVKLEDGEPWSIDYTKVNVAQALVEAKKLADGKTSDEYYELTGKVKAITGNYDSQYGNMSFTVVDADTDTETLTVFRLKVTAEEAATVLAGATVVVRGQLQNYVNGENHTYEFVNGKLVSAEGGAEAVVTKVNAAEALVAAKALGNGATSDETYELTAKVKTITDAYSSSYGNISFTVVDTDTDTEALTIYRLKVTAEQAETILVGATVVLQGQLKNFVSGEDHTYEMVNGKFISAEGGEAVTVTKATVAEVITAGTALANKAVSENKYEITGYAVKIEGPSNIYIADSADADISDLKASTFELYNVPAADLAKILKGSKITVTCLITNYSGTIENSGDMKIEVAATPAGTAWEGETKTVEEAYDIAVALNASQTGEGKDYTKTGKGLLKITCKVKAITSAYSDQYGNISFTIEDDGGEHELVAYRVSMTAEQAAGIVAGADIVINGFAVDYVKNTAGTQNHTYRVAVVNFSLVAA